MQKLKISLVELYGHSEVLYILYRLLKNDYEVSVFTTQTIFEDAKDYFETELNDWYIQPKEESIEQFFKKNLEKINTQDILIFVTLISSFRFFSKMNFKAKTIITFHNVNTILAGDKHWWIDTSSLQNFTIDVLRFFRNWIRRDRFYKQKLLQKVDHISFSSNQVSNYAKSIANEFNHKIINPLPFLFFEDHSIQKVKDDETIISIPGAILQRRRDYEMIYEVMKDIVPTLQRKIKLQLLGKAKSGLGENLIKKMRDLECDNFELVAFQKPVSQKEFDQYLRQTDFMILPLKRYKKFGICREEYGQSTISGGSSDIARFGIPTLLIKTYKIETSFQSLITHYENKTELKELINDWIGNLCYIEIRNNAIPKMQEYREEKVRTDLIKLLQNL